MEVSQKQYEKIIMREFEEKLILEVKNHSCIYAKDDLGYSNKNKRNDAWDDIAVILGRTVVECQKKWTTLRDSFRAYFRAEQNIPSGSGATPAVKWSHFQSLKFLIPYVRVPGDDCENFSEAAGLADCSLNENIDVGIDDFGMTQEQLKAARRTKKPQKRPSEEPLDRVLKAIESTQRKPMQLFMENIALQVEDFSQQRMVRFQSKILEALTEELKRGG